MGRSLLLLGWLLIPAFLYPQVPSPDSFFGHQMGADRRLIGWSEVISYYRAVAEASSSVRFEEMGRTTEDRPFPLVTISAPQNLAELGRFRRIQERLADPRITTPAQAEFLIPRGKAVVLITCSIHSNEVASTFTAMEYVYRLLTQDTPRNRKILDEVIFLLVPSLNPDGVDKVKTWYDRWLRTPYEGAPMVDLYHAYTGHDNNRDWYAFTQQETKLAVEKVHNVWRPQIVYDVHQMGSSGARMFVPPWADPIDPNIDPLIAQQANAFGSAIAADLTAEGKTGIVVNGIYDYFTPARHYQSYHGGMRLLSESASVRYATPIETPFSSLQTQARGYDAQTASWNFLEPWKGGVWRLRDIVDYQLVAFESVLYSAALRRDELLRNFYRVGRRALERRNPIAFVVPRQQHDPNALSRMLKTLQFGLVEISRARASFTVAGRRFVEGDYVIRMDQPYSSFAKTLLERQMYPAQRQYPGGPPRRPYDATAHSLPLLMGVDVVQVDEPLNVALSPVAPLTPRRAQVGIGDVLSFSPAYGNSWIVVNRLMNAGRQVYRDETNGRFFVRIDAQSRPLIDQFAQELEVDFSPAPRDLTAYRLLRRPRIGLYKGFVPTSDEGWTRWVLDQYEFDFEVIGNTRIRNGSLANNFDVVILPDAAPSVLHAGYVEGASYDGALVPPAYSGGIGDRGAAALRAFVQAGGSLVTFNSASTYAIERLGAPVENILSDVGERRFYAPGALLNVDVETTHPLCFGMRPREALWFESGPVFRRASVGDSQVRIVTKYPSSNILASGWLLGDEYIANRAAVVDVSLGRGHFILFGVRPQYRGQSNASFKMVFNSLFYWQDRESPSD